MIATQPRPLYIRLQPGRRFASTVSASRPPLCGVVLEHFTGSDGWDWYHVRLDVSPDLVHQYRRDAMKPLRKDWKPVYARQQKP